MTIADFEIVGDCVKCKVECVCVAVRNGLYCRQCFIDSVDNRVKMTLIKSGKVDEVVNEDKRKHILIAVSSGMSSNVLSSIIRGYMVSDVRRKARFSKVTLAHVHCDLTCFDVSATRDIIEQHGLSVNVVELHDALVDTIGDRKSALEDLLANQSSQARQELIDILRMHRLRQLAVELGCNGILFAENNSRLAIKTIANTARGRGYTLPIDTAASSDWDGMFVIRPLHNIDTAEVEYYAHYKNIRYTKDRIDNAIDKLTTGN